MSDLASAVWEQSATNPDAIASILAAIASIVAAILIVAQIRSAIRWNRLQTTHSTLREVVVGQFGQLLKDISLSYDWDIVRETKSYQQALSDLNDRHSNQQAVALRSDIQSLLRILETVCISVDRKIVDEAICRDYIFSIATSIYRNTADFIAEERRIRGEPKVFQNFEKYALRWGAKKRT